MGKIDIVLLSFAWVSQGRRPLSTNKVIQVPADEPRINAWNPGLDQSQKNDHAGRWQSPRLKEGCLEAPSQLTILVMLLVAFNPAARSWQIMRCSSCSNHLRFGKEIKSELGLDTAERSVTVDTLKAYLPRLLRRDPDWKIFAEDFKFIDHVGGKLKGIEANKLLFKLLRRIRRKLILKDEVEIQVKKTSIESAIPVLMAQFKVRLGGIDFPIVRRLFFRDLSMEIEADIAFHFNDENLVSYARIEKCIADGQQLELWPDVKLSDSIAANLNKVKQWVVYTFQYQMLPMPALSRTLLIQEAFHKVEFEPGVIDETGGVVWESGRLLANLLGANNLTGQHVLELGSGTGVGSVTAAAAGAAVTATDGDKFKLRLIKANARINDVNITVQRLRWGNERHIKKAARIEYDLIIGSDLLYSRRSFPVLIDTLNALSTPGHTEVLIVYQGRTDENNEKSFVELADEHYELLSHQDLDPLFIVRLKRRT